MRRSAKNSRKRVPSFDELGLPTINGVPVFTVHVDHKNMLDVGAHVVAFRCPYCKGDHCHGVGAYDDIYAIRHRIAHCTSDRSPLRRKSYYIVIEEEGRRLIERRRRLQKQ